MNRPGENKPPLSFVLTYADEEALVWDHGAGKHGVDDWRNPKIPAKEFLDAALRHAARIQAGELIDSKSGLPHAAHMVVNMKIYGVKTRENAPLADLDLASHERVRLAEILGDHA